MESIRTTFIPLHCEANRASHIVRLRRPFNALTVKYRTRSSSIKELPILENMSMRKKRKKKWCCNRTKNKIRTTLGYTWIAMFSFLLLLYCNNTAWRMFVTECCNEWTYVNISLFFTLTLRNVPTVWHC